MILKLIRRVLWSLRTVMVLGLVSGILGFRFSRDVVNQIWEESRDV